VLKARARYQKISRNQIRRKHQAFMRREFGELVAAWVALAADGGALRRAA
jgi:hypothetical protein